MIKELWQRMFISRYKNSLNYQKEAEILVPTPIPDVAAPRKPTYDERMAAVAQKSRQVKAQAAVTNKNAFNGQFPTTDMWASINQENACASTDNTDCCPTGESAGDCST